MRIEQRLTKLEGQQQGGNSDLAGLVHFHRAEGIARLRQLGSETAGGLTSIECHRRARDHGAEPGDQVVFVFTGVPCNPNDPAANPGASQ